MIRRPGYIKSGDTIGITAPSYGPGIEPYSLMHPISLSKVKARGYKIIEGETVHRTDGIGISTDPKFAAGELTDFYKRKDIDAIISAGGGELMNETIGYVDFDELKEYEPKWFMGYSDNTNFIFPMVTIAEVQGIYGPCIGGFAKVWEDTEYDSFALLEGAKTSFSGYGRFVDPEKEEDLLKKDEDGNPIYDEEYLTASYQLNADRHLVNYVNDRGRLVKDEAADIDMQGILVGGCLDVMENLVGTRFDRVLEFKKKYKDLIWIFEACDLTPMSIRRSLWNLREAGWLEGAKGFIIGRPAAAWKSVMLGCDQYNAVTGVLDRIGAPVIMDAEIGHIDPMLPVIMGAKARVSACGDVLNISYL